MTRPAWEAVQDGLRLRVRLTPRGGRDAIDGPGEGHLRVRVAAPPVEGAANAALCRLLADRLGLAGRDVRLIHGGTGRIKTLHLAGNAGTLAARLLALQQAGS